MTPSKRKRASDGGSTASDDASEEANSPVIDAYPSPFVLQLLKKGQQNSKRQKKDEEGRWTAPKEEASPLGTGTPIFYKISPREVWDNMKKYKQFVVQDSSFTLGDYVYINNGTSAAVEAATDDRDLWVAQVMECRAESPSSVWIRIRYLYWPHELPDHLKRTYFGVRELVQSNHMDIIDAQCVEDKADVSRALEKDENAPPATNLYWRQYFDFLDNKLAPSLRRDCICKQPHNPDYMLIRCPNESCGKWLHEDCLAKEACKKHWERMNAAADEASSSALKDEDSTIKVTTPSYTAKPINKGKAVARKPGRKSKSLGGAGAKDGEEPWHGVLAGTIERSPPDDEASTDISGECIIKVTPAGQPATEVREPLFCPFCDTALGAKGEPLTPPRDS